MIKYFVTNSFTLNNKGGNPAGVVYLGDAIFEKEYMQKIANELGFSETAFIGDSKDVRYDYSVRFFTPTEEVDLCGHATLASFYILSNLKCMERNKKENISLKQSTKAGILKVNIKYTNNKIDRIVMEQGKPKFYETSIDIDRLVSIFNINQEKIGYNDLNLHPMICSTGLRDIILPIKDLETLRLLNTDFKELTKYSNELGVVGVHAFTFIDKHKGIIECRNFAPAYGINEESATGTSNGALGAYLIKNKVYTNDIVDIKCIQGVTMNNESEIAVRVSNREVIEVKVGGKVTLIDQGYIKL